MTQEQARGWFPGTSPEIDPLGDRTFWAKYKELTGHDVLPNRGSQMAANVIPSRMNSGQRVSVNLDLGAEAGHSVVIDHVVQRSYQRVNGSIFSNTTFYAMNPSLGTIVPYQHSTISNAFSITFIHP